MSTSHGLIGCFFSFFSALFFGSWPPRYLFYHYCIHFSLAKLQSDRIITIFCQLHGNLDKFTRTVSVFVVKAPFELATVANFLRIQVKLELEFSWQNCSITNKVFIFIQATKSLQILQIVAPKCQFLQHETSTGAMAVSLAIANKTSQFPTQMDVTSGRKTRFWWLVRRRSEALLRHELDTFFRALQAHE